jgi:hypothetical protein
MSIETVTKSSWRDLVADEIDNDNPSAAAGLLHDALINKLPQAEDEGIVEEMYGSIILLSQMKGREL